MKNSGTIVKTALTLMVCGMLAAPITADAGRFRGAGGGAGTGIGPGVGFVDANGDGINDNFVDADGDGLCDITGLPVGTGTGTGYRGGRNR